MLAKNEVHKMFYADIRDKKRTGSNIHKRTGKRGYVGKMRMPSEIMSRKDKYNYRKAGKVVTSNYFQEILYIDDFLNLDKTDQKNRLTYWRENFSNKEIIQAMGTYNKQFYDLIEELKVPAKRRIYGTRKTETGTKKVLIEAPAIKEEKEAAPEPQEEPKKEEPQEILINGLSLQYTGTFSAETIQKQINKFDVLLDGETDDFYVEIKILQKA